jgi:DNA-binding Lrp family transcriptional regulator
MEEVFPMDELEGVLELWNHCKDPKIISKEMGLSIERVNKIIEKLKKDGQIDIESILTLEEFIDKDVADSLKLNSLTKKSDDTDYFFTSKDINVLYDAHIFEVTVESMSYESNAITIFTIVNYKFVEYKIAIIYYNDEDIHYGSVDEDTLSKFRKNMGPENMELFDEVTNTVIEDYIPTDFWDVRELSN